MLTHELSDFLGLHAEEHELEAVVERLLPYELSLQVEDHLGGGLDKWSEIFFSEDVHKGSFVAGVLRNRFGGTEPKIA